MPQHQPPEIVLRTNGNVELKLALNANGPGLAFVEDGRELLVVTFPGRADLTDTLNAAVIGCDEFKKISGRYTK